MTTAYFLGVGANFGRKSGRPVGERPLSVVGEVPFRYKNIPYRYEKWIFVKNWCSLR